MKHVKLILVAALLIGYLIFVFYRSGNAEVRKANADFQAAATALTQRQAQELMDTGTISSPDAELDALITRINAAVAGDSSIEAVALRVGTQIFADHNRVQIGYMVALKHLQDGGFFHIDGPMNSDDIAERRRRVLAFQTANANYLAFTETQAAAFADGIRADITDETAVKSCVDAFVNSANETEMLAMRRSDAALCDATLQLLDLLEANPGTWKADTSVGRLIFTDPAAQTRSDELQAIFGAEVAKQQRIQAQLNAKLN